MNMWRVEKAQLASSIRSFEVVRGSRPNGGIDSSEAVLLVISFAIIH
jgi:hypothetical protein